MSQNLLEYSHISDKELKALLTENIKTVTICRRPNQALNGLLKAIIPHYGLILQLETNEYLVHYCLHKDGWIITKKETILSDWQFLKTQSVNSVLFKDFYTTIMSRKISNNFIKNNCMTECYKGWNYLVQQNDSSKVILSVMFTAEIILVILLLIIIVVLTVIIIRAFINKDSQIKQKTNQQQFSRVKSESIIKN